MTSMSVKDVSFLVNFVGQQGPPVTENTGKSDGFFDIMSLAASRGSEKQPRADLAFADRPAQTGKAPATPHEAQAQAPASEAKAQGAATEKASKTPEATPTDTKATNAETSDKVTAAAEEILGAIAEKTGLSLEEILAVLAAMGLILEEVLDPASLRDLLAELTAADPLALVTDQSLYDSLSDLLSKGQAVTEDLLAETGLTAEELAQLLEQLKAAQDKGGNQATLTEPVNLTNATAEQQAAEVEQRITITVERDGKITEVVAKADDKGNITGVKDIQTSETEPNVTVTAKGEASDQTKQQASQNGQHHSGQESLLNTLLQARVAAVEARLEPILMPEAPNTEMIMRQIMDYMKVQLGPEVDRLEMQLHPESLGTVGVKIISNAGIITAQFTAGNEMVKAAIESQIVELRDNMRQQGLKVETIEVHVQSQAFNSSLWQQGQSDEAKEEQKGSTRRRINLSEMSLEELTEDMSDEERLNAEMMVANGQTVDFMA